MYKKNDQLNVMHITVIKRSQVLEQKFENFANYFFKTKVNSK